MQQAIDAHALPWNVTQLGCRAEYQFLPEPARDGTTAHASHDGELERYLHLHALNRGVMITPFHNMALMSPATTRGRRRRAHDVVRRGGRRARGLTRRARALGNAAPLAVACAGMAREQLFDGHGRAIRDVRISVTDRCNFRCQYCMPAEGLPWLERDEVLTLRGDRAARARAVGDGRRTPCA